jgi:TM2 domain-containing membrane protein YozV
MRSTGVAYLLWLPGLFGVCGLHRFYAGKPISGLIWLFTCGLLWVGQFIDLFLIPGLIAAANWRYGGRGQYVNQVVNVHVDQSRGRRRRDDDDDDDRRPRRRRDSYRE